ncbi:MAG: rod shape-determining protein MreD [Gammaproteobacteria bacterium]|nr:rod shape-determining protein MreD [Gammaproteobacteria bacterium]
MIHPGHRGGIVVFATIVCALALSIMPMPDALVAWRPEWATMTVIYWCMATPLRVGVAISWITGLMLDALRSGLLGQQALALALIGFIALKLHRRIRVFPLWQQSGTVFILIMLQQFLQIWIDGFSGHTEPMSRYLLPTISSALLWPVVFTTLRYLRRRLHVH